MEHSYSDDAKVFKAFCDENRLQILAMLRTGEKCACMLLENLNVGQSTLSHHMKILCEAGIVEGRTEGKWTHYSISETGCNYAKEILNTLTNTGVENSSDPCSRSK
jgi:ArsR family transcriptional regulator, arsenate/arsenite/antimonite-responsive transcriptional repressor